MNKRLTPRIARGGLVAFFLALSLSGCKPPPVPGPIQPPAPPATSLDR